MTDPAPETASETHQESYEDILGRARAAAALKRWSGEVPEGTGDALDSLFLEVAPGGARMQGEGLEAALDMLSRYRFDPAIALGATAGPRGRAAGLLKRALQPVAAWQLRHLTDQLNAYHLAEVELLRAVVQAVTKATPPGAPRASAAPAGAPTGDQP